MNIALVLTTILASAADSINPVAITQQFVLQGMVKKRSHIWCFIWATFITNFICGLMAYYGLLEILLKLWKKTSGTLGSSIYIAELFIGISLIIFAIYKYIKIHLKIKKNKICNKESEESVIKSKIKSVSPPSLFMLGVAATILELTSAFPYFAFLGVLLKYQLSFPVVLFIQALYNLIYTLPLMLLYFIYCKKQTLFDNVYTWIKNKMERLSLFIPLILFLSVGSILIVHSIRII